MSNTFKPNGYNSVSPYFVVDGAERFIDILKKVFDAKELRKYNLPDGKIMHAEIKIDDSVIMIGDSNEKYPPNNLLVHVYVSDVKTTFRKAINAGFEVIQEPMNKEDDPDLRGMVKDFQGNIWAIGTQIKF